MVYLTGLKTKRISSGLLILLLCAFMVLPTTDAQSEEEPPDPPIETKQKLPVLEFYILTNTLPRDLIDLQNKVDDTADTNTLLDQLPALTRLIDEIDWDARMATSKTNISLHQLSSMESRLVKIKNRIDRINTPIAANIRDLESLYRLWLEKENKLQELRRQMIEQPVLSITPANISSLEDTVNKAKALIESHIIPSLQAGESIGKLQTRVYAISLSVSDLIDELNVSGIRQTSPTMLTSEFYARLNGDLAEQAWANLQLFARYQRVYLQQNILGILFCLSGIILLAFLVRGTKAHITPASRWHSYAARPLATTFVILGSAVMFYDFRSVSSNLPPDWNTLLLLPLMIAAVLLADRLSSTLLPHRLINPKAAIAILAIAQLLTVLGAPQPFYYLYVFSVSAGLLVYQLLLMVSGRKQNRKGKQPWFLWLGVLFPLVIIVLGAAGYDQFATAIFIRVLSLIVFTTILLLIYDLLLGLLEMVFYHFPVSIIRSNSTVIVSEITPILIFSLGVVWVAGILKILWIFPTISESLSAIGSAKLDIGSMTITTGLIMTVAIAAYITHLCSHAIRAVLLQETLPRYKVEHGVQLSITRLIHYAILTIGVLVILRILGFGLGQITIIGGALGVGIGFGLQAIVTNFVSGLILLFERPIKVGDVVVVGEDVGEVKEMGLRATTVQTFDNAEIVIPNSELITKNLTNWTLANKRVRVKVPVGVAYGTNIETVLKILLSCASDNPTVLSKPEPIALFLAFGDSSLNFELRVWISDFNDKLRVLSELNQNIEAEFERASIEIPFPQRDLHIRTIEKDLSGLLQKKGTDAEEAAAAG